MEVSHYTKKSQKLSTLRGSENSRQDLKANAFVLRQTLQEEHFSNNKVLKLLLWKEIASKIVKQTFINER